MKSPSADKKKIIVIGSGPGGLAAAMLLAHRGFHVDVFEKSKRLGGRNGCLEEAGYRFDIGPTFLMMKFLLDSIFDECEASSANYLKFTRLEPMYELRYSGKSFKPSNNPNLTKNEIEKLFPGASSGFDRFMQYERKRFEKIIPCLQRDYSSLRKMVSWRLMQSLPYLSLGRSVFDVLKGYFKNDDLSLLFSFQSKYLGMSAWQCPGGFSMLSYIEHAYGIYHTEGGLAAIPEALAKVALERGAQIHLGTGVKTLILDGRDVTGVELESGERVYADAVVLNADFAQAMTRLVPGQQLKKYSPEKLAKKKFSCSTFMLHLGLDTVFPSEHHTIVFADDYKTNVKEIFETHQLSKDISFYVRNASINDPTLAPKGHSSVYILVPVPNLDSGTDWTTQAPSYRDLVLDRVEHHFGWKNLRAHIQVEKMMTPDTWHTHLDVYKGATFNLAHNLGQMAYWRPRNQFEELGRVYLTGGGTHPGSGLPTILESARISANLISKRFEVPFLTKELAA